MKLYLERSLASHRHGRYFISQLEAEPIDEQPSDGLVLIHGKSFQGMEKELQRVWWAWANRPGCALVLVPPFNAGLILDNLDWRIALADNVASSDDGAIPNAVADEVVQRIEGGDGEFDRNYGHQWTDFSVNTRFIKQHSGSGVFAATCLPLWSISLLDLAEETTEWLCHISELAGKPGDQFSVAKGDIETELVPTDYTLLVCLSAWGLKSVEEVKMALESAETKMISLSDTELSDGFLRLIEMNYVNEIGISEEGLDALMQSAYWIFAERLKEESQQ